MSLLTSRRQRGYWSVSGDELREGSKVATSLAGRNGWVFFGLLIGAMLVIAWFADDVVAAVGVAATLSGPQLSWLAGLVLAGAAALVAGVAVNGRWSGVFVDSRNRYSLSQMQTVVWMVIVSSAIVAAGVGNVHRGIASPLALQIPIELLAVLGLTATSLAGTPVIRNAKRAKNPDEEQATRTESKLGTPRSPAVPGPQVFAFSGPATGASAAATPAAAVPAGAVSYDVDHEGTIVTYADARQTTWSDLIRGEETGNADKVDLGKLQLLYITAVIIFVYCAAIFANLNPPADADGHASALLFAGIDASFVGLLGLSHAGALAYLAAPHSKTTD
jgi:hypothetical protein